MKGINEVPMRDFLHIQFEGGYGEEAVEINLPYVEVCNGKMKNVSAKEVFIVPTNEKFVGETVRMTSKAFTKMVSNAFGGRKIKHISIQLAGSRETIKLA